MTKPTGLWKASTPYWVHHIKGIMTPNFQIFGWSYSYVFPIVIALVEFAGSPLCARPRMTDILLGMNGRTQLGVILTVDYDLNLLRAESEEEIKKKNLQLDPRCSEQILAMTKTRASKKHFL